MMAAYWLNRILEPFKVAVAGAVAIAGSYCVFRVVSGGMEALGVLLVAGITILGLYLLRVLVFALAPYRLKISDGEVVFPAYPASETFRWWAPRLAGPGVRFFAAQNFEGSIGRDGFTGSIRSAHVRSVIVRYPIEEITSITVERRGLTELTVSIGLIQEDRPFVLRIQTLGWPITARERVASALRRLAATNKL